MSDKPTLDSLERRPTQRRYPDTITINTHATFPPQGPGFAGSGVGGRIDDEGRALLREALALLAETTGDLDKAAAARKIHDRFLTAADVAREQELTAPIIGLA
jgi:hypothetical protein